jgi:hypothetical protein
MKRLVVACLIVIFLGFSVWIIVSNLALKRENHKIRSVMIEGMQPVTEISPETISALPSPVQHYIRYSVGDSVQMPALVQLKHAGWIQVNNDSNFYDHPKWKYLVAENWMRMDKPALFWQCMIHLGWEFYLKGWDILCDSLNEQVRFWMGACPVSQTSGVEIREFDLGQYLIQAPWMPMVFVAGNRLQWEAISDTSARVTLRSDSIRLSGVYHFNNEGQITRLVIENQPRITTHGFVRETRMAKYVFYKSIGGYQLPDRIFHFWKTPGGWISDADFRLDEIVYR